MLTERRLTENECFALLESYKTPGEVVEHCAAVSRKALRLAAPFPHLDRALIKSAALLHDIAKAEKNHALRGGNFILSRGYPRVAEIILSHHNLKPEDLENLTESTVVFYADKLVSGTDEVTIEERFARSEALCSTPEALTARRLQYDQALKAQELVARPLI